MVQFVPRFDVNVRSVTKKIMVLGDEICFKIASIT